MLLCLLLALTGCKKAMDNLSKDTQVQPGEKFTTTKDHLTQQPAPGTHAPTGVVVSPGAGGGGSGGAAQAVRKAVVRTVNQNELNQLRLFIDTAATASASGQLPPPQEIAAAMQREAPSIHKLLQERILVLSGARSRETIWAYTNEPQNVAGEHLVVTANGVERMTTPVLQQRLAGQQGR